MITDIDSLFDLFATFPDEQSCLDHMRELHWRDGKFCPYCGDNRVYHFSERKTFKCGACRQRFSIKVGTIFEDTRLPLRKWFTAIWLITNHPKGIASTTLAKELKVTQKTAWFVLQRLRHAARTNSFNAPLKGTAEAVTTFVGGKEMSRHAKDRKGGGQGGAGKEVLLGTVEREGELRITHIADTKAKSIHDAVKANVEPHSVLMTNEDRSFIGLEGAFNIYSVNHSKCEYARFGGWVHTNSIESVWALLKRQIIGVHYWVSPKHLHRYANEMSWRLNRRDMQVGTRMNDIFGCMKAG